MPKIKAFGTQCIDKNNYFGAVVVLFRGTEVVVFLAPNLNSSYFFPQTKEKFPLSIPV